MVIRIMPFRRLVRHSGALASWRANPESSTEF
jgi:hypothetical protein